MRGPLLLLAVLVATPAVAERPVRIAIPAACTVFADREDDGDDVRGWTNLLSLATCMQEPRVPVMDDPAEVRITVETLTQELAPSMLIYVAALQNGPPAVQLRASYAIGLTSLALVTRVRSAIPPANLADPGSVRHAMFVHALAERWLEPAKQTVRVSMKLVVQLMLRDRSLAADPALRAMVDSALSILRVLEPEAAPTHLVRRSTGVTARTARLTVDSPHPEWNVTCTDPVCEITTSADVNTSATRESRSPIGGTPPD